MPGVSGVLVVTNARAYCHYTRGCECSGARHSLRPLIAEGGNFQQTSSASRCEGELVSSIVLRCLKIESVDIHCARKRLIPQPSSPA
jgi:hypothetical protein